MDYFQTQFLYGPFWYRVSNICLDVCYLYRTAQTTRNYFPPPPNGLLPRIGTIFPLRYAQLIFLHLDSGSYLLYSINLIGWLWQPKLRNLMGDAYGSGKPHVLLRHTVWRLQSTIHVTSCSLLPGLFSRAPHNRSSESGSYPGSV